MLQEMNACTPNYWLAYDRLKDPKTRLELLQKHDPDAYAEEVLALQNAERENSQQQE